MVVLLVAAGLGLATTGSAASARLEQPARHQSGTPSVTPTAVEVAVVPARSEIGPGPGTRHSPGRSLLPLVAALLALTGAVGLRAGRSVPSAGGCRPLAGRRHAISLRAPPSLLLV